MAFDLPNGVDERQLTRAIEHDQETFAERFSEFLPACNCKRYAGIRADSSRPLQVGLRCSLCMKNGAVRTLTGREIRTQLAPVLFAHRLPIAESLPNDLTLDAHESCIETLGRRSPDLYVAIKSAIEKDVSRRVARRLA